MSLRTALLDERREPRIGMGSTTSSVGAPRTPFRKDVEGLRAVAIIAVVLYHASVPGISGGYIGVDVFFVISGFLITGMLFAEHERSGSISILGFYARRVRRVLPAASLVLCTTVICAYFLVGVNRANSIAGDSLWVALFAGNFHFAAVGVDYFNRGAPASPLLHYWSLGVEEQFYVAWPLLLVVLAAIDRRIAYRSRVTIALGALLMLSLAWSVIQTSSDANFAYFSPFTRAWELGLGAMIALTLPSIRKLPSAMLVASSWLGLAAIVVSAFVYTTTTPFPGVAALLPVIGAGLVIAGGTTMGGAGAVALLGLRPVRYVGRISYSFYLWHWPALVLAAGYAGRTLPFGANLALVAGSGVLAALTYRFVESPVRESKFLRSHHDVLSIAIGLALIGVVLVVALVEIHLHQIAFHTPNNLSHPVFP